VRLHANAEGVAAAVNAARGGAADALRAVAPGGRLATITGDPPSSERGVQISNVYVRPDGVELGALVALLDAGRLSLAVAGVHRLEDAALALRSVVAGHARGAVALMIAPPVPRA
jgi:hypothetical protein